MTTSPFLTGKRPANSRVICSGASANSGRGEHHRVLCVEFAVGMYLKFQVAALDLGKGNAIACDGEAGPAECKPNQDDPLQELPRGLTSA